MSDLLGSSLYQIGLDDRDFVQGLGRVEGQLNQFGSVMKGLAAGIAGIGLGRMIASGFGEAISQFNESASAVAQLQTVLKSTANAAGLSFQQLKNMADDLKKTTIFDKDDIIKAENMLLTFTNIGEKAFPTALKATLDLSKAMGQDAKSSAIQLGKALQDPVHGITALKRVGVSFSDQQKDLIKTLVESGKTLEAQKVILAEINKEFGQSSDIKTYGDRVTKLKQEFNDVGKAIAEKIMPSLEKFVAKMREWIATNGDKFAESIAKAFNGMAEVAQDVMPLLDSLANFVGNHADAVVRVGEGMLAIGTGLGLISGAKGIAALTGLDKLFSKGGLPNIAKNMFGSGVTVLNTVANPVPVFVVNGYGKGPNGTGVGPAGSPVGSGVGTAVGGAVGSGVGAVAGNAIANYLGSGVVGQIVGTAVGSLVGTGVAVTGVKGIQALYNKYKKAQFNKSISGDSPTALGSSFEEFSDEMPPRTRMSQGSSRFSRFNNLQTDATGYGPQEGPQFSRAGMEEYLDVLSPKNGRIPNLQEKIRMQGIAEEAINPSIPRSSFRAQASTVVADSTATATNAASRGIGKTILNDFFGLGIPSIIKSALSKQTYVNIAKQIPDLLSQDALPALKTLSGGLIKGTLTAPLTWATVGAGLGRFNGPTGTAESDQGMLKVRSQFLQGLYETPYLGKAIQSPIRALNWMSGGGAEGIETNPYERRYLGSAVAGRSLEELQNISNERLNKKAKDKIQQAQEDRDDTETALLKEEGKSIFNRMQEQKRSAGKPLGQMTDEEVLEAMNARGLKRDPTTGLGRVRPSGDFINGKLRPNNSERMDLVNMYSQLDPAFGAEYRAQNSLNFLTGKQSFDAYGNSMKGLDAIGTKNPIQDKLLSLAEVKNPNRNDIADTRTRVTPIGFGIEQFKQDRARWGDGIMYGEGLSGYQGMPRKGANFAFSKRKDVSTNPYNSSGTGDLSSDRLQSLMKMGMSSRLDALNSMSAEQRSQFQTYRLQNQDPSNSIYELQNGNNLGISDEKRQQLLERARAVQTQQTNYIQALNYGNAQASPSTDTGDNTKNVSDKKEASRDINLTLTVNGTVMGPEVIKQIGTIVVDTIKKDGRQKNQ